MLPKLKVNSRDREYKQCPEHMRDQIIYIYLFEGKSHRWLDERIVGEDASYSRGWVSMGVLHHIGLINDHKGLFKDVLIEDAVKMLEEDEEDFRRVISALNRYHSNDYTYDGLEYFLPAPSSPLIIKEVGKSQYTDGVRIEKEYHDLLNPSDSEFYVNRGTARPIKVLFNNKIFDAEYRYEGQTDERVILQSIRFRKALKDEFKKVFPEPVGRFTIQYGFDLEHFVFNHEVVEIQYPEDEEKEYAEGREKFRLHKTRERNPEVIKKAKKRFMMNNAGRLFCEVCSFDFTEAYGERGEGFIEGFIEGHHTKLISELKEGEKTKVEDIAMVCSNCHRMIHRKPIVTVNELKSIVKGG